MQRFSGKTPCDKKRYKTLAEAEGGNGQPCPIFVARTCLFFVWDAFWFVCSSDFLFNLRPIYVMRPIVVLLGNHFQQRTKGYRNRWVSKSQVLGTLIRARQRSGKGVVWRNGCPKGFFWRVRFLSVLFRFALKIPENLQGAEKKRTLQKHPFGQLFLRTTPSPLLWRTPI